jgi:electron transport complex protein RnfC
MYKIADTFFADKPDSFTEAVVAYLPDTAYVSLEDKSPCVQAGTVLKEGQVIAKQAVLQSGLGEDSWVHSPTPGILESFVHCPLPSGETGVAAKIRVAGKFSYLGHSQKKQPLRSFDTPDDLCRTLAEKGVLNLFTHPVALSAQIDDFRKKQKRVLVVRLYDNDESMPTDSFIAAKFPRELAEGAALLAWAAKAEGVLVLSRKNGPAPDMAVWTEALKAVSLGEVPLCALPVSPRYHLFPGISEIAGIAAKTSNHDVFASLNHRDLYVNAATLLAVERAITLGLPVMESIVHISGYPVAKPGIFVVRNGLLIADVMEECGGFTRPWALMVVNGVISGTSITSLNTPITKDVQSIRFLHKNELPRETARECIRCGACRTVCPCGLEPVVLMEYILGMESADPGFMEQVILCEDCGLCNAVCPSRLPLSQFISRLKRRLVAERGCL